LVVNQDLGDATADHLEDGTRDHRVASEREDIIHCGVIAERPALDGVRGSESVDDLHKLRLSRACGRSRDIQLMFAIARLPEPRWLIRTDPHHARRSFTITAVPAIPVAVSEFRFIPPCSPIPANVPAGERA
jgi:hypothetical protein